MLFPLLQTPFPLSCFPFETQLQEASPDPYMPPQVLCRRPPQSPVHGKTVASLSVFLSNQEFLKAKILGFCHCYARILHRDRRNEQETSFQNVVEGF
jgi:hypothetical protein